jgi:hypothetical protein
MNPAVNQEAQIMAMSKSSVFILVRSNGRGIWSLCRGCVVAWQKSDNLPCKLWRCLLLWVNSQSSSSSRCRGSFFTIRARELGYGVVCEEGVVPDTVLVVEPVNAVIGEAVEGLRANSVLEHFPDHFVYVMANRAIWINLEVDF